MVKKGMIDAPDGRLVSWYINIIEGDEGRFSVERVLLSTLSTWDCVFHGSRNIEQGGGRRKISLTRLDNLDHLGSIPYRSYLMSVAGPRSEIAVSRTALRKQTNKAPFISDGPELRYQAVVGGFSHDSKIALIDR